jgi:hypothetical protein
MTNSWPLVLTSALLLSPLAMADVTYQENTQINGGSMVGMAKMAAAFSSQAKQALAPSTTTIMIHGNKMVRTSPISIDIIDLDAQTMTSIDRQKHTYYVTTFQQMQQAMADAAAKMKNSQPAAGSQPANGSPQMSFDAHVTSTGATRTIEGQTAQEMLVTITMLANQGEAAGKGGMAATTEMWLVKDEPGMDEIRAFNLRMMKEMPIAVSTATSMTSMIASQPGGAQALDELSKQAVKVSGMPVLQVTRVGMTVDGQPLAAPSVAPLPQSQAQGPNRSTVASDMGKQVAVGTATQEASSGISRLGGFGRALGGSSMGALLSHQPSSKPSTPSDNSDAQNTDPKTAGILMENQVATTGFSTSTVDTAAFEVPAGYKQVQSPMSRK